MSPGAWPHPEGAAASPNRSLAESFAAIRNVSASWRGHGQKSRLAPTDAANPRPAPKSASSKTSQAQFHAFTATWTWADAAESVPVFRGRQTSLVRATKLE